MVSLDPSERRRTGLTDRLAGVGGEVLSADSGSRATAGGRRRLAELQRVSHFVILVYGLPFIAAVQGTQ